MKNSPLHKKIEQYIRTYYLREWIKGAVLFAVTASLLFLFLVFLEWILWIPSSYRKILIYFYLVSIVFFFGRWVVLPLVRYAGYFRDLDEMTVARDLASRVPGLKDRLVNYLQLENLDNYPAQLLTLELQRREKDLSRYDFTSVLHFRRYLPFFYLLLVPLFLINFVKIAGKERDFNASYNRVLAYNKDFVKPAPFRVRILSPMQVKPDTSMTLQVSVSGKMIPEKLYLLMDGKELEMTAANDTLFAWFFDRINRPVRFSLRAGKYTFGPYEISLLAYPVVRAYRFHLHYPAYTRFDGDTTLSGSYLKVPYGTRAVLEMQVAHADTVEINGPVDSVRHKDGQFRFYFRARQSGQTSLRFLNSADSLAYTFRYHTDIIPDNKPLISVKMHTDTGLFKRRQVLAVTAEDDYGLTALHLYYKHPGAEKFRHQRIASLRRTQFQRVYLFPYDFHLPDTASYEYFLRVYDNNAVDGPQYADSRIFRFEPKDTQKDPLKIQEKSLQVFSQSYEKQGKEQQQLDKTLRRLQTRKQTGWEEMQRIRELMQNQRQRDRQMQELIKEMERLSKIFQEKTHDKEKAREINRRLEELKDLYQNRELEKEIQKLLDKMNKQGLLDKLKQWKNQNEFKQKSLERTLELLKRFYVEEQMKAMAESLKKLAKEQNLLSQQTTPGESRKQEQINRATDSLSRQFHQADSLNKQLKDPLQIPDMQPHFKAAQFFQKQAMQQLKQSPGDANKSQRKAGDKLSEMAQMMQSSMQQSQEEQEQEDLDQIKRLIHTLLEVSFDQEKLLDADPRNPYRFSEIMLEQNKLHNVLKKVSDTLFAIGSRQPQIGKDIYEAMNNAIVSAEQSLQHLQEKEFSFVKMRQHTVLQEVNELIYLLNLFLDAKQRMSLGMGQGKGNQQSEQQLQDKIKKRSQQIKKGMEEMMKKGGQKKQKQNEPGEEMNGSVYQLYKEQQQLKDLLEQFARRHPSDKIKQLNDELDKLSEKLLRQGINPDLYKRYLELQYELLKLTQAAYRQQTEEKREARQAKGEFTIPDSVRLELIRKYFPQTEQLRYYDLPLTKEYQLRYKRYKRELQ